MFENMLLTLAVAAAAVGPTPSADGLTYPGHTREAADFNLRWDAHMKRVPKTPAVDEQIAQIDWMVGSWIAQPRDFPSAMTDPSAAEKSPASAASIAWTVGKRWLRITFIAEPWHVEWNYYLGHDPLSGRWVMDYLASPSLRFDKPATASGWSDDRLVFQPTAETYKGFRDLHRFILLRKAPNSFRIVNEVRMPSGKFVAMDDVLFTRK